jgi:hypothetical protein
MDKLEQIYKIQFEFTKKFFKTKYKIENISEIYNDKELLLKWNKEFILALIKESTELLDELDWKSHISKTDKEIKDNFLEEGTDVFKYLFVILIINGFDIENIYNKFIDKSNVVDAKFEQEQLLAKIRKDKNAKIAFVDIDGVIGKWPECFIQYISENSEYKFNDLETLEKSIPKQKLYEFKLNYRLSGIKRTIEVKEGIRELLSILKQNDYYVILLTARPYKKIFRIYSDTIFWLKYNKIPYDAIIWDEEKAKYIIQNFKENFSFVIDDCIKNVNILSEHRFNVFFKYNSKSYANNFSDIVKSIDKQVNVFQTYAELIKILENLKYVKSS